ncbi:MAG: M56 family metallopeptidase [Eubacterium sp.]|nr:M56 family metallopeptidase [Eubacterium sp.]
MSLVQMSFYGAVLTLVVMIIRAVAINRLPKRTFLVLWCVVLVRLIVPFQIPCEFSVYSMIGGSTGEIAASEQAGNDMTQSTLQSKLFENGNSNGNLNDNLNADNDIWKSGLLNDGIEASEYSDSDTVNGVNRAVWLTIWGIGTALCAIFFAITYIRCRVEFSMSLPIQNVFVEQWLAQRGISQNEQNGTSQTKKGSIPFMRRVVTVRTSDRIDTPLTYGVIHPVILLPKRTAWEKTEQLEYVLWHEYMHICYGDNVLKLIMIAALCLHWFNPFVWAVYFLLNRDIELACDESVIRRCGVDYKSTYAAMLIGMEAKRSGLMPMCNSFGRNAIEERVRAIMKIKKFSLGAVLFAAGLVVGVTTAFATSAAGKAEKNNISALTKEVNESATAASSRISQRSRATGLETDTANTELTQEEYEKLLALCLNDYEDMTISEYRDQIGTLTDTVEYIDLLDRYFQNEALSEVYPEVYDNSEEWEDLTARGHDDPTFYLHFALEPLIGDRWQERDFSGYLSVGGQISPENMTQDMATLEYMMVLTILDADRLTVGEYIQTRLAVDEGIKDMIASGYSIEELADEAYMRDELRRGMDALRKELGSGQLQVDIEYTFQPLDALEWYMDESGLYGNYRKEREEDWEEVLKPYMDFGLTTYYDAQNDEGKMFFYGREVRGIIDEEKGIWITEHSGIGEAYMRKTQSRYMRSMRTESLPDYGRRMRRSRKRLTSGADRQRTVLEAAVRMRRKSESFYPAQPETMIRCFL